MKKLFSLIISLLTLVSCFNQSKIRTKPESAKSSNSFYDHSLSTLEGGELIDFHRYKGKKVVLLNVASKCGYTPQYADWEAFHKLHGEEVIVLGFPANNFMAQEPGSNSEIAAFCQRNYGVTFQMFEKISVKGPDQHPLYQWLSSKDKNGWNDQEPSWNFCKYLVNEQGELTHFFASGVKPDDAEFRTAVGF